MLGHFFHQFLFEESVLCAQAEEDGRLGVLGNLEEGEAIGEVVAHEFKLLGRERVFAGKAKESVFVAHVELAEAWEGGREGGKVSGVTRVKVRVVDHVDEALLRARPRREGGKEGG